MINKSIGNISRRVVLAAIIATTLTGVFASSAFAGHALITGDNRIH